VPAATASADSTAAGTDAAPINRGLLEARARASPGTTGRPRACDALLIGLSAKNAILIVEFAKVRVDAGMDPFDAPRSRAIAAASRSPRNTCGIPLTPCSATPS